MTSLVDVTHDGPIARLTLDRPDARNALSVAMCNAIVDALGEIQDHQEARVIALSGAGKVFCSGADFGDVNGPGALDFIPAFERMLEAVARFRLPVIASIHKAALGGGLQLATACDFRIATDDAALGIPSSRLGIVVNFENVQRLVLLVGTARAKELLMTGRRFSGEEAVAVGLLNRSVPPDSLSAETDDLAEHIAELAPLSVQGAKAAVNAVGDQLVGRHGPDIEQRMAALVLEAYHSNDLQEGLRALSEKRDPRFEGS